eukprot:47371-Amphidinium_carterae.1
MFVIICFTTSCLLTRVSPFLLLALRPIAVADGGDFDTITHVPLPGTGRALMFGDSCVQVRFVLADLLWRQGLRFSLQHVAKQHAIGTETTCLDAVSKKKK